jgi:aspartyl-tRNA(Asn)/glutamyl-tRNA(Gln) amidotransferase subunit C
MEEISITIQDVEHLAEMSALEFSEKEKSVMLNEIKGILNMFNGCADADDTIKDKSKTISLDDLRPDEPKSSMSREEIFMNAPRCEHGYIVVPKVVD